MHRSGTSALAGVLNILGVSLGSNIMSASDDNPKGFFENNNIMVLHEKILKNLCSSWHEELTLPEDWWDKEDMSSYKKEIIDIIKQEFINTDFFGIKDPRLCLLLPLWNNVFKELNIKPYFIIPLRNPMEIALSLKKRNWFPVEKSLLLWSIHMLQAEFHSRKFPRVFIIFDDLIEDPGKVLNNIADILDIRFPKDFSAVRNNIEVFLDRGLKHHNVETDTLSDYSLGVIFDYYNLLSSFACRRTISDNEIMRVDTIRESYFKVHNFFYYRELREWIKEERKIIFDLKNILHEKDSQVLELEQQLEVLLNSRSWRITAPLRSFRKVIAFTLIFPTVVFVLVFWMILLLVMAGSLLLGREKH